MQIDHPSAPVLPEMLLGLDNGLDEAGRIRREGDLSRVAPAFRPLVEDVESTLRAAFGSRLHSIYLYGSVPRGTAVEGRSDLDVTVVLHDPPTADDHETVARLSAELDQATTVVDEVGIVLDGRTHLMSADQRYDGAFHISCLCSPLWGPDLADELPDQFPCAELARDIGRDAQAAFARLAAGLNAESSRPDLLRQRVGRRIARLALATVLARWPGWTSDPAVIASVVTAFYPDRVDEITVAVRLGWGRLDGNPPNTDQDHREVLHLLDTAAQWWLAEHARVTSGHTERESR